VFTTWEYKKEIEEYLESLDTEEQTLETTWMDTKQMICKAVQNALRFYPKRIRN
jgi:hypothetical protein